MFELHQINKITCEKLKWLYQKCITNKRNISNIYEKMGSFLAIYEMKCVHNLFSLCYSTLVKFIILMVTWNDFIIFIHEFIPQYAWGGQRTVRRVTSLFLPCGSQWSHLGHYSWQHTEPSYWPLTGILNSFYSESLSLSQ